MDSHYKERLAKASGTSGWTHHDFRRLFATVTADELGVAPHVIEAVLAHASGSQVARVYNRAKHLQPMREALLAYEKWLWTTVHHSPS